jgi:hypothetical protein
VMTLMKAVSVLKTVHNTRSMQSAQVTMLLVSV